MKVTAQISITREIVDRIETERLEKRVEYDLIKKLAEGIITEINPSIRRMDNNHNSIFTTDVVILTHNEVERLMSMVKVLNKDIKENIRSLLIDG